MGKNSHKVYSVILTKLLIISHDLYQQIELPGCLKMLQMFKFTLQPGSSLFTLETAIDKVIYQKGLFGS